MLRVFVFDKYGLFLTGDLIRVLYLYCLLIGGQFKVAGGPIANLYDDYY